MASKPALTLKLQKRVARTISRAQVFSVVERAWPRLVLSGVVLALFLILSWFNLWSVIPDVVRVVLVGLLALGLFAALGWAFLTPKAKRGSAIRRVETASGLQGHPVEALDDKPFHAQDAQTQAIWHAHQERMARKVDRLAAGLPKPQTQRHDPWALRAAVGLLLVVAFFVAGPDRLTRLEAAFAPIERDPGIPIRVDVWATPPSYTGLPPRTLLASATLQDGQLFAEPTQLPVGSKLTVLISEPEAAAVTFATSVQEAEIQLTASADAHNTFETLLDGDATLTIARRANRIVLPLNAVPDAPPTIRFVGIPQATPLGGLSLSYQAEDDYAVESAKANVSPSDPRFQDADHLVEPPMIDLVLPQDRHGGTVETTRDISSHPWAGLPVHVVLTATDGANQSATSQTRLMTLPMRPFRQDLARALVEQRRLLAVDRGSKPRVLTALEGLALAPDVYMEGRYTTYLAMTVTTQRLRFAETDQDLLEIVELLWQLALQVEDGDLSLAAERLREAEENLAEALENGAPDEQIEALMDELRQAFQDYMQALAERMQGSENAQVPPNAPSEMIDPLAMQELMDQIEDLAEMGAAEAARELLEQLRQQLDQLRGAQAMQQRPPNPMEQQLRESIEELQSITREQQRLLDETFPFSSDAQRRETQRSSPFGPTNPQNEQAERPEQNAPDGAPDQQSTDPLDDLADQQRALEEQLQALMDQLRELGLDPSQFGEAGEAMEGAAGMLDRANPNTALGEQGRALEALRQGAQSMMEQLANGQGQPGQGEGQAQGPGQSPGPGQGLPRVTFGPGQSGPGGTDPLGRPQRDQGRQATGSVRIPEESDIQRARDILDEIQRRLGEQLRPQTERDYLDRLIERF